MKKYKVHLNISFENKGHYGTAKFVEAENAKEAVLKVMEKVSFENKGHYGTAKFVEAENAKEAVLKVMEKVSFDGKCEINITVVEVKA